MRFYTIYQGNMHNLEEESTNINATHSKVRDINMDENGNHSCFNIFLNMQDFSDIYIEREMDLAIFEWIWSQI